MHDGSMVALPQPPVLPEELVAKILSFLSVESLMRFRCVNKSFNSLISDPHFVQMHLKNSSRNPHLAVMSQDNNSFDAVLTLPISLLLNNPSTTIQHDPYFGLNQNYRRWLVIGSCNGLLCLLDRSYELRWDHSVPRRFCLWNPANRTESEFVLASLHECSQFSFGYDNLNETYKVVAYDLEKDEHGTPISEIKVFSTRDIHLINIQRFPAVFPVNFCYFLKNNSGVYLSGTINWLVLRDYYYSSITIEQHVILSLNLSTETYTQLLLPPQGFDNVPPHQPKLVVLMDCLCVCHDFQNTHFVIWQMKDFGVEESWIQLYKIGYKNLSSTIKFNWWGLLPLYLSENGDTLIWTNDGENTFIYNCKDNRVVRIGITNNIRWFQANDYVESLVSTR